MADQFQIIPYKVRSAGTDVPPEEVQAAVNSLALQTTIALNSVVSAPTGPAGGDLGGTYPNPTVVKLHVTSGTESGVAITASTVDSTPVGATTPSTGAFTTATAGSVFASGGAVPGVGATGTQIYNSPNPTVQFIDSIRSANNKNAFVTWGATVLAFGFANDAFTTFVNALTITGGQAAGISGITSNSGSGSWVHTGGFSATSFAVTNAITVANGGTGRQTLTAHGVLLGEGTAAINQTAVGTTGQMLLGATGADPAFGNNPTITGGSVDGAPVGATTPSTGAFTTLAASGAVSGAGFTARFASPGPIGSTAASTGAFTAITATSTITPSSTAGIVGTTTNDSANVGSIGEYVTATSLATSISSSVAANAASISLTAGDWDVSGVLRTNPAGSTVISQQVEGISTTSATLGAFSTFTNDTYGPSAGIGETHPTPSVRISIASTTTVFLIATVVFSTSTCTVDGMIRARRVR